MSKNQGSQGPFAIYGKDGNAISSHKTPVENCRGFKDIVQIDIQLILVYNFPGFFETMKASPREDRVPIVISIGWMFFFPFALLGMPYSNMDPCPRATSRLLRLLDWCLREQVDQAAWLFFFLHICVCTCVCAHVFVCVCARV